MSRIRTIKPEFWTSEQVVSCSLHARLLFIGLWNFCDDHGVHPASYVRLKAEVFPVDSFTIEQMTDWIGELIANGLVHEYAVDKKSYWIVTGWNKHQRIDKPTYRHPLPLSELQKITDNSPKTPRGLADNSATTSQLIVDASLTDRNGMDRNGMDKDIYEVETSPVTVASVAFTCITQEVFDYWQKVMNHPRAKLDKKRRVKIEQALKAGYCAADLTLAIDGCAKTPHNMGKNDSGQKFDDICLILRDAEHIERFMRNAVSPPSRSVKTGNSLTDLMAGVI